MDKMLVTIEGVMVECDRCGYVWLSRSKLMYLTCPSCMQKTKRIKTEEDWGKIKRRREKHKR